MAISDPRIAIELISDDLRIADEANRANQRGIRRAPRRGEDQSHEEPHTEAGPLCEIIRSSDHPENRHRNGEDRDLGARDQAKDCHSGTHLTLGALPIARASTINPDDQIDGLGLGPGSETLSSPRRARGRSSRSWPTHGRKLIFGLFIGILAIGERRRAIISQLLLFRVGAEETRPGVARFARAHTAALAQLEPRRNPGRRRGQSRGPRARRPARARLWISGTESQRTLG